MLLALKNAAADFKDPVKIELLKVQVYCIYIGQPLQVTE